MNSLEEPKTMRARDAEATKAAILQAAGIVFTRGGASAGLREIASAAGVNVALIGRYFGSKEELLHAVLFGAETDFASLLGRDRSGFGRNLATFLVKGCRTPPDYDPTLILLRSLGDRSALDMIIDRMSKWLSPLAQEIGGANAQLRAELIVATIAGFKIMGQVAHSPGLSGASDATVIELLGDSIQAHIDP